MKLLSASTTLLLATLLIIAQPVVAQQAFNDKLTHYINTRDYAEAMLLIDEERGKAGADIATLDLLKGSVLARMGRHEEAMRLFRGLIQQQPNNPTLYNNLGVIHAEQGQLMQAKEAFEQALALDPNYLKARYNLGDVYAELACQTYRRIPDATRNGIPGYCSSAKFAGSAPAKPNAGGQGGAAPVQPAGVADPAQALANRYVVNLASQTEPFNPDRILAVPLAADNYLYTTKAQVDGKTWYRLRVGFYGSLKEAQGALPEFRKRYPDSWVSKTTTDERRQINRFLITPQSQAR